MIEKFIDSNDNEITVNVPNDMSVLRITEETPNCVSDVDDAIIYKNERIYVCLNDAREIEFAVSIDSFSDIVTFASLDDCREFIDENCGK